MVDNRDYDVVVVGGGGGGLAAALTAAEAGASVLLVEAAAELGGSTALAGGSFMAAGTSVQRAAGFPDDTVEEFYDYYRTLNQFEVDPAVVRRFCEQATPTLEWLAGLGVEFRTEGLYRAGLERSPRSHRPVGAGRAIVDALHSAARKANVDIAVGQRISGLVVRDGRVNGVRSEAESVTAWAVIITTGGFGPNLDLVRKHYPDAARAGDWVWSPGAATCAGDGLALAEEAGAGTTGTNRGELVLTPGFARDLEPFLPAWLVFVNGEGRRFVDESSPYAVLSTLVLRQGGRCWVVLDEAMRAEARPNPASAMFGSGSWSPDVLSEQVAAGRVQTAPTLDQLAQQIAVPARLLASTIAHYNADAKSGVDSRFGKPAEQLRPVSTPPFFAVELRPAVVALTGYGLRIDPDARVLRDIDDEPIPGLYAAGEVTGSLLGPQYVGGGNAIGNAVVFGRIAGRTAAADRAGQ